MLLKFEIQSWFYERQEHGWSVAELGLTAESDGPEQRMTVAEQGQEGTCVKLVNDATEKLEKMVMRWCILLYRHEEL